MSNRVALGAQVEYYPISQQVSLSISPGYAFNNWLLGYLKLGWVYVPSTVDQGPGRQAYDVNLNGVVAGIGVKAMITRGVYGYAELNYVQLERLKFTSWAGMIPITGYANTKAYNAVIGVGYRF
jgi:opacity protein-like surface antigen